MNWSDWYKDYESFPSLQARLKIVREQIAAVLNECPGGSIRIISICAGDGRDILGALQDHPRRNDVACRLLDNNAESIARGKVAAQAAGLAGQLQFVEADATLAKHYLGVVPADLVLLSGFLGHLPDQDIPRLINHLLMLCKQGGWVIWNRHLLIQKGREQVPAIREFFREASFTEFHYETTDAGGFAVGRVRFDGQVLPLDVTQVLFQFVGLDQLLPIRAPKQNELSGPGIITNSGTSKDEISCEPEQSIPARFETIAALYRTRSAVDSSECRLTYEELNVAANRLAHVFIPRGAAGDRVALLMRHNTPLIVAILAVLKAGRIVVVLNPTDPPARLKQILAEAETRLILTDMANRELASQIAEMNQEVIGFEEPSTGPAGNPGIKLAPEAVAFIIFTSGSAGKPKGVMQTHRNIIHNVLRLTRGMQLQEQDRISLLASPSGGQGLSTIWCALLNGAALCPFPMMEKGAADLANWIDGRGITVFISSASIFRHLMKSLAANKEFFHVRLVRVASEPASAEDFEAFKGHFSNSCVLFNTLSSSETGNITQHRLTRNDSVTQGRLPMGHPAEGVEVLLLDKNNREVLAGEVGEMIIKSRYLSPGYWRNELLTAERFVKDNTASGVFIFRSGDLGRRLPDGSLMFVDRKDARVKIHGYGVELSEIEDALAKRSEVENVFVSARTAPDGETQIFAHIVPRAGQNCTAKTLRRALRKTLPAYMVPAHFVFLEKFPLTPHGKIDRESLPSPLDNKKSARRRERPRDIVETRLTKIWESALGVSPIGRHDDFFDLGGTSLQSVEILSDIEEAFNAPLSPSVLAEHSTVEQLSAFIAGHVLIPSPSPLVLLRGANGGHPLFFIHTGQGDVTTYVPLARRLRERPIYGLQSVGLQGESWPLTSVPAMARRYLPEILAKDPTGPYLLAATCMGGLVAFELAQMLVRQGKKVGLLCLMDSHFPLPLTWHEPWWRKIYVWARTPLHANWRSLRWKIIRACGLGRSNRWLPGYRSFIANENGRASRSYRPIFYPGELTLLTTIETQFVRGDPRLMMQSLAQTTRVVKIRGKRSGLFMKPAVDELARELQSALEPPY